jgi:hypothetical protein
VPLPEIVVQVRRPRSITAAADGNRLRRWALLAWFRGKPPGLPITASGERRIGAVSVRLVRLAAPC